ncbi:MAG TPA: DUF192 domain-containing protein [Dongiaceae bacterium]
MTRWRFFLWLVGLAIMPAAQSAQLLTFERDEVLIETASGSHEFSVELAVSPDQRAQGLMFRQELGAAEGMLFLYPSDRIATMWMKNTMIPLDMLFIAADGRVVRIAERTVPQSTETISSEEPVRAVLELNGGTVARLGIEAGAVVRLPASAAQN